MLLSTIKQKQKANDVLGDGIETKPISGLVENITDDINPNETVTLEDVQDDKGGLMLYTSGTTNRPVNPPIHPMSSPFATANKPTRKASSSREPL